MLKLDEIRGAEDLSDVIDVLYSTNKDMEMLSLFRKLPSTLKATSYKHEWQDDQLEAMRVTIDTSATSKWNTTTGTTDMPLSTSEVAKVKVGDLLLLTAGNETVRITDVDVTAETVDVTRAWGGTATAQGATAFTASKAGNAQEDGSDPISPNPTDPTERYNYIQIFEKSFDVSRFLNRQHISRSPEFERQRMLATKALIEQIDSALYYGVRKKSGNIYSMGGLRETATTTQNVGGNVTPLILQTSIETMINAGGFPDQAHVNTTTMKYIEIALQDKIEVVREDYVGKFTVKMVNILGITVPFYVNRWMPAGEIMWVDSSRAEYGPYKDSTLSYYDVDMNGKQMKGHIVGAYTLSVKNPAAALLRSYGITGGATS